ncbi:hypothetical protein AgCh_033886 [Apium graveolens]
MCTKQLSKLMKATRSSWRKKCEFVIAEVEYLGHVVSKSGVAVDNRKIEAMQQWPTPTNGAFDWNNDAGRTFSKLKNVMTTTPVLTMPDFSKKFVIETDASHAGIGAVLMQEGHPIAYLSKALSPKHLGLSTTKKELLAILLAIQKWRTYILGQQFVIKTDHEALKHFMEQKLTTIIHQKWL